MEKAKASFSTLAAGAMLLVGRSLASLTQRQDCGDAAQERARASKQFADIFNVFHLQGTQAESAI